MVVACRFRKLHHFHSQAAIQKLPYLVQEAPLVHVTTANGDKLSSSSIVPEVTWYTQGHTFTTSTKVLDIPHYDMILGMDWLEQFSPMWVDWKKDEVHIYGSEDHIERH